MFLGIEVGGTKLQLGVGRPDGSPLAALTRLDVAHQRGAAGILSQIEAAGGALLAKHPVRAIGIGFGGPVDAAGGRVVKSHHVDGWDDFPLCQWCQQTFGLPIALHNDCDAAGLAEARCGAGQGSRVVLYVTVGTGIGGGLIVDGHIYRGNGAGAAEIGHLRPGLHADRPDQTVESLAAGWGIAAAAQARLVDPMLHPFRPLAEGLTPTQPQRLRQRLADAHEAAEEYAADLRERCDGHIEELSTKMVAEAAADGNELAREVIAHACQALGWGIAQALTLLSPGVVVIGGGVSLMDQSLLLVPLRDHVARYVFPPLAGHYRIVPAQLGELAVVHGALAIAAGAIDAPATR